MSLIQLIENLKTTPRKQDEEYENTSDFLEWFYINVYLERGFEFHPALFQLTKNSGYQAVCEKCKTLININNTKNMDNDTLTKSYEDMKNWVLETLKSYGQI